MIKKYKTIDLFAGIGGIRRGFELTESFENTLSAEIDSYACKTYEHLYHENPLNDVTTEVFKQKVKDIKYDTLLGGFPCQSFSRAGNKLGFLDLTRGTLFFDTAEIIKGTRPKTFLLENVDNLLSHDRGHTFKTILNVLTKDLNYHFEDNLSMINTLMPAILSEVLKEYYFESFETTGKRVAAIPELVELVADKHQHPEFRSKKHIEYKMKQYLFAVALGVTPSKEWFGRYEANGGYLIVKANGEIGIYHLINLNEFQDYLFYNTKLETASTERHEFGTIYKEQGKNKIKLNLQIRFSD